MVFPPRRTVTQDQKEGPDIGPEQRVVGAALGGGRTEKEQTRLCKATAWPPASAPRLLSCTPTVRSGSHASVTPALQG